MIIILLLETLSTYPSYLFFLVDDAREHITSDLIGNEVVQEGFYTDYCAEIDLGTLAVNTICASDELKNVDKEASRMVDSK